PPRYHPPHVASAGTTDISRVGGGRDASSARATVSMNAEVTRCQAATARQKTWQRNKTLGSMTWQAVIPGFALSQVCGALHQLRARARAAAQDRVAGLAG